MLTPWDVQSKRINSPDGTSPTLPSGTGEGMNIQPIIMTTANTNANGSNYDERGGSPTPSTELTATPSPSPKTSAMRSDWRGFDGSLVGAVHTGSGKNDHFVCMGSGQANAEVREDGGAPSLTCLHEAPIVAMGDCGQEKESADCRYAKYRAEQGEKVYEYICISCGHRFMSGDGPVESEMDEDWYRIRCPKCGSGRYVDASKATVCMADDNGKSAVDVEMCGSLKVGGGSAASCVASNGDSITGPLCARDFKGVGNEYVSEGKVVMVEGVDG